MSTKSLQVIDQELGHVFNRLQNRVKGGCKIWVKVAVEMVNDWRIAREAKEKKLYGGLMQIESMVNQLAAKKQDEASDEVSDESVRLLRKIGELKGIVSALCLCLISLNILAGVSMVRRPNSGRMKLNNMKVEVEIWD